MPSDRAGSEPQVLDGKYALDRELGRGGMGIVFEATARGDRPALRHQAPPGPGLLHRDLEAENVSLREPFEGRRSLTLLGVVACEALTGTPPFTGDAETVLLGHYQGTVVPPSRRNRAVPPELDGPILAPLAKHPADRPPTARRFVDGIVEGLTRGPAVSMARESVPSFGSSSLRVGKTGPAGVVLRVR